MARALWLAQKGRDGVHPNPMVGAVLVRRGRVVAEGFHRRFGGAHAEIVAIERAGARAKGSTLYVNLEPCAHWGKTPPCADAIMRAGIKRVVAAMRDPNPRVSGKGLVRLRRGHVSVIQGVLEDEARDLNRDFAVWVKYKRPYVTLKMALSLDGRTATLAGDSKWITGKMAREAGHSLRARADAVAVGLGTVKADNPSLTAHGKGKNPIRIIFDSRLRSPLAARVFSGESPTWCMATKYAALQRIGQFQRKGVEVTLCRANAQKRVSVPDALKRLAEKGITHLLVEGGMTLARSFLNTGAVDEAVGFVAPIVIGHAKRLRNALHLKTLQATRVGEDICIRGQR